MSTNAKLGLGVRAATPTTLPTVWKWPVSEILHLFEILKTGPAIYLSSCMANGKHLLSVPAPVTSTYKIIVRPGRPCLAVR